MLCYENDTASVFSLCRESPIMNTLRIFRQRTDALKIQWFCWPLDSIPKGAGCRIIAVKGDGRKGMTYV